MVHEDRLGMQFAPGLGFRHHAENLDLPAHVLQNAQHSLVPFRERERAILESLLLAPAHDIEAGGAKPVPRYAREEVVRDLHVEAAVQEVEVGRAGDVHRRADLAVREAFARSQIDGRLGEMRQNDLGLCSACVGSLQWSFALPAHEADS